MSAAGNLDLRLPIGGLFVILGVILAGYGLATAGNAAMYANTGGLNINLWWGVIMLLTGLGFLWLARRDNVRVRAELAAAERGTAAPPRRDPATMMR